jgi:hypothetical protein
MNYGLDSYPVLKAKKNRRLLGNEISEDKTGGALTQMILKFV